MIPVPIVARRNFQAPDERETVHEIPNSRDDLYLREDFVKCALDAAS
jgi:hypothetical protein